MILAGSLTASTAASARNDNHIGSSSDRTISREVSSEIVSKIQPTDVISVKTSQNIVTLRGFVDSAWAKQQAVEIARGVPGVQGVRDELVVDHVARGSHT
jgi:hyperosmotically inducible protein